MLAYLINQYPKTSHSFIRREIRELERQGWQVQRIALRSCNEPLPERDDQDEQRRTTYILGDSLGLRSACLLLAAVLATSLRRPRRFLQALTHAARFGWGGQRPWPYHLFYLAEACQVSRLLRAQHLHAHFGTNAAEVAMLAAILSNLRYSVTIHGPEEFDHADRLHLHRKLRHAAFVVAISAYGRSQLYRWLPHTQWPKVHVIRCGLGADYGTAAPPALPPAPTLVCIGRLCAQKGQLLLLEACRRVRAGGSTLHLVLAGDGEMRQQLQRQIALHNLQDVVQITGWLSGDQVRQAIGDARAVVLPSFAEGLPVVLMEAMALGRPVLSTYVAGIPELVKDGCNGWLVPAGDPEALAQALVRVLATPLPELARMGANGRQDVAQLHSLEREVAALGGHFRRCIAAARPP